MYYKAFSLNGAWEMNYREKLYEGTESPWTVGCIIEDAVPGYWEDMTEVFGMTPFYNRLKINPNFGIQKYPISGAVPHMALPNIVGNFLYRKTFVWEQETGDTVLYMEGVQNAVRVWVNDVYLGQHEGYSTPFEIKIPQEVLGQGENTIVLSVSNFPLIGYSGEEIFGLTSNKAACEYTGGITGNVELRLYQSALRDISVMTSADCKTMSVSLELEEAGDGLSCSEQKAPIYQWRVYDGGKLLKSGTADGDFVFDTEKMICWSPENPKLYTLEVSDDGNSLIREFGVRRLTVEGEQFRLNGTPYYLRGICEHCYYPDTVHPPHDLSFYRKVIKKLKSLGFNFIRFHTYIPHEEYMQAADELGMLLHVESPNYTTLQEWKEIVGFCRRHTSVVIYCCGNELYMDDAFIEHLHQCADEVHTRTDSLFSPMSALRGFEYHLEHEKEGDVVQEPFAHNPRHFKMAEEFCDMYSSYALSHFSYISMDADPAKVSEWGSVYRKPRVSHEICIDGTYTDLSLKKRYENSLIGKTDMFDSIERHLTKKGLIEKAPLYFRNSCEWQRRVRKHCFESVRLCENMAGYDFLGPIDTHWHTFGYDVGMMNEFYELKPGESVRNVLMYNSATVLLQDLNTELNFYGGSILKCGIYVSHYGEEALQDASLQIRLSSDGKVFERRSALLPKVGNGKLTRIYDLQLDLPKVDKPEALKLYVSLDGGDTFAENEWELYVFPETALDTVSEKDTDIECLSENISNANVQKDSLLISNGMSSDELILALKDGKDVVLLGAEPFVTTPTSYRISLAGRTSGDLATVIYEHPILRDLPHEGFCGWQFKSLLTKGEAVCFEAEQVPFEPIIEIVSTHKCVIKKAALFEYKALNGRLLVCSFRFAEEDPAAAWLKAQILSYVQGEAFAPKHTLDERQLKALINSKVVKTAANTNFAADPNDQRRKKSV